MTDHDDTLDDLASAYLDDELSADEQARVAADERLVGRVEQLGAVREALRSSGAAVDPTQRDRAVAAALAAFDGGQVASLAVAGHRRSRRAAQLVGVAAAVALLALAVPFLGDLDSGSDDAFVAGRTDDTDQTMSADASASEMSPEALTAVPGAAGEDLGAFGDVEDLATVVRSRLDGVAADAPPGADGSGGSGAGVAGSSQDQEPCAAQRAAVEPVVFSARATLDGRAVLVLVRSDDVGRTLLVYDVAGCAEAVSQPL